MGDFLVSACDSGIDGVPVRDEGLNRGVRRLCGRGIGCRYRMGVRTWCQYL